MDNQQIASLLRETADLMEIAGEDPFRIRGYRRAAETVAATAEPIAALAAEPARLRALPGIGIKLAEALTTMVATGDLPLRQQLLTRYQPGMLELLRVQGLGPKTIALIWEHRGAATLETVEALARRGQLRDLPRMSAKKEEQILRAVAAYRRLAGRFLRSTTARAAAAIAAALSSRTEAMEQTGSFRRGCETSEGLELAAVAGDRAAALAAFAAHPGLAAAAVQGGDAATAQWTEGGGAGITLPVRLLLAPPASFGVLLLRTTGPDAHWEQLQQRAASQGLLLDGAGLHRGGEHLAGGDEDGIYRALGLPWIPPELRDTLDVSAASASLPPLIAAADIRADLHMHTIETDGRATIEEMAAAAVARGYRTIAITDHSQALAMARGMNEARALAHIARIRAADQAMGGRLRILTGIEVDILADGRLDLEDAVLAEMDLVIASVHSKFDQPEAETTARLLRAIANPYVRILGHPTARRLLRREPIAMDLDTLARACATAGVAMEINASPERLDLNADLARTAARHGVRFAINTDAHHPDHLGFMTHGIATARRAGLAPQQVLNTLDPSALFAALRPRP